MHDFLTGYTMFHWVEGWSNPALDLFFRAVTDLGYPFFYYLLIAPLFWVVDRRRALVLFLLLLLAALVNGEAKLLVNTPRPDPQVVRVLDLRPIQSGSPAFPSGHAQIAVVFWGYLALWARRRWFQVLAVFLIAAISFSRIYLGAHFPIDVVGGLILGIALLAAVGPLDRWAANDFASPPSTRLIAAVAALLIVFTSSDSGMIVIGGCLLAVVILLSLPQARLSFSSQPQMYIVVAVGLLLQLGSATLLGQFSGEGRATPATGVRIALLWLIALWLYPQLVAPALARLQSGLRTED